MLGLSLSETGSGDTQSESSILALVLAHHFLKCYVIISPWRLYVTVCIAIACNPGGGSCATSSVFILQPVLGSYWIIKHRQNNTQRPVLATATGHSSSTCPANCGQNSRITRPSLAEKRESCLFSAEESHCISQLSSLPNIRVGNVT